MMGIDSLVAGVAADLQQPGVLWQLGVVLGCVVLAWVAARALQSRQLPVVHGWRTGQSGLNRALFPLLALGFIVIARPLLRQWQSVHILDVAASLLLSLAVIRVVVYALRQAFAPSGGLAALERVVALVVWLIVALHILGVLPDLIERLDSLTLALGKRQISVWMLLQGAAVVIGTLVVALWASGLIDQRLTRATTLDASLRVVLARVAKALLVLLAVLISLPLVGLDLTTLSVFGGALGVGLGFGLQKIASNYVSGFIILLDRSIRMGNLIAVDKYSGRVTEITTRYTVLRAGNGVEALVPNELLIGSVVQNQTFTDTNVRHTLQVQVGYDSDVKRAMEILVELARRQPRIMPEPAPAAFVTRFADSGIELELGFWITDPENGDLSVRSALSLQILDAFRAENIAIPYPQQEVRLVQEKVPG